MRMGQLTKIAFFQEVTRNIRLAVIPSDPIEAYKIKGTSSWLEGYYNPGKFADKVYALSPHEKKEYSEFGMTIIPTQPHQLSDRIRQLKINLVRAYGGYSSCDIACNNKVDGIPVVVSVHDTNPRLLFDSIKRADVVFCTSEVVRCLVLTKFNREDRVWILPNRVNFDVMRPYNIGEFMDLEELYPYKYKILHVGRKAKEKNLDTLLYALKELGDDYCLLTVGRSHDNSYQTLSEELNVSKRCFFIESIPNEQLPLYYSFADCMCTPSRWEGFGLVFIEAMACEAVVVTSNIAPMNNYITHGENGILVDRYEDPHSLAKAIKLACTDDNIRELIKKNARNSVVHFGKDIVDSMEVSYYKKVLDMNSKGLFKDNVYEKIKRLFGREELR